jgi:A/G-specific adenine glycosylase
LGTRSKSNYNRFSPMRPVCQLGFRRLPQLRQALLEWYVEKRRDLPWRRTRDPYRIWVSEIMLQQTRVQTVVPRYWRFLRRFPSLRKLATAPAASVLAEWSGLGYYRRARNLHAAARLIAGEHGGRFPNTFESWRRLPGVGRYTAAAIVSIAFDEPMAVLDGNVDRVLCRLLGRDLARSESWNAAQQVLDPNRPGDFNQAIMELGATICVSGKPLCDHCPITPFCRTRGRGQFRARRPRRIKARVACVLRKQGDFVLLVQRSAEESLMPGMWELPKADLEVANKILFRLSHAITVTNYEVTVVAGSPAEIGGGKWVRTAHVHRLALTGLAAKILRRARIIQ